MCGSDAGNGKRRHGGAATVRGRRGGSHRKREDGSEREGPYFRDSPTLFCVEFILGIYMPHIWWWGNRCFCPPLQSSTVV